MDSKRVFYIPSSLSSTFFNGVNGFVYKNPEDINVFLKTRLQAIDDPQAKYCIIDMLLRHNPATHYQADRD